MLAMVAGVVLLPHSAWSKEETAGRIETLEGSVAVIHEGVSEAAAQDRALFIGDQVVTGETGKVVVALRGGGTLTAGSGSRFNVSDYARDDGDDRGIFGLLAGIMRASLEPDRPWDRFEVQSRTVVASARNTEFVVEVTPLNTAVLTIHGHVGVAGTEPEAAGQPVIELGPGEGTDVARGVAPKAPAPWGAARVRAFLERTTLP